MTGIKGVRPLKSRKLFVGCLGTLLLTALLLVEFVSYVLYHSILPTGSPYATLSFNRNDWIEDQTSVDGGNRRGHMAEDILKRQLRNGMSEARVKQLLGEPDAIICKPTEVEHWLSPDDSPGLRTEAISSLPTQKPASILMYYLGEELGPHLDRAWMYLYFDKQGRWIGDRLVGTH